MARSEQQIYDDLLVEKAAVAELNNLNSSSNTAIWRKWLWIVAKCAHVLETLWDAFKVEVEETVAAQRWGTPEWYVEQMKAWQYGHTLVLNPDTGNYEYAADDEAARLITRVAIVEQSDGGLLFKVAKNDGSGGIIPLTAPEQAAAVSYLNKIKVPGTITTLTSLNADRIRVTGTFYYDAQYDLASVKSAVDAQISLFLANLPYNGALYVRKLEDALQATLGWKNHNLDTVEAALHGSATWTATGHTYNPQAGYVTTDTAISTQLNFVAV